MLLSLHQIHILKFVVNSKDATRRYMTNVALPQTVYSQQMLNQLFLNFVDFNILEYILARLLTSYRCDGIRLKF